MAELGRRITSDYAGKDLVLVTVLRGGIIFLADLCRAVDLPLTMDFMAISAYSSGGGVVRITKDLDDSISGRDVLVVEDIIDTGLTLNYLLGVLRQRKRRVSRCARSSTRLSGGSRPPDRVIEG